MSENNRHFFDFFWVIRCSGSSQSQNAEYRTLEDVPSQNIKPILEIVTENLWDVFLSKCRSKFGDVYVEFPAYLSERSNKFLGITKHDITLDVYSDCAEFFSQNTNKIDIPVVSTSHPERETVMNYDLETGLYHQVKRNFSRVGVRTSVPTFDISVAPRTFDSFRNMVNSLDVNDILFLDIFYLSGVLNPIHTNLQVMINLAKKRNIPIYILNAFEPEDQSHNYGPYLYRHFNIDGFGDFATEKRYPTGGRDRTIRRVRKIIRYYNWDRFQLLNFKAWSYSQAADILKQSGAWRRNSLHNTSCPACIRVESGDFNEWSVYWKEFRIKHYLCSILNETLQRSSSCQTAEDLDPDGHDTLFNISGSA